MESFNMMDGLVVTVISMVFVFSVLASLWGLTELVHRFSAESKMEVPAVSPDLIPDKQRETVAVLTAIIAAHETNPAKKYEVVEVKRIK
ncbi:MULTISPECIES: OadG family protein [unclassified Jeotgalibaca]|uniref:OadG family protein n=1 Tax=unclassified Jeotgalibaca TaxID=2621505 RepID=UPI003FD18A5E